MKEKLTEKMEDQWEFFVNGIGQGIQIQLVSEEVDPGLAFFAFLGDLHTSSMYSPPLFEKKILLLVFPLDFEAYPDVDKEMEISRRYI